MCLCVAHTMNRTFGHLSLFHPHTIPFQWIFLEIIIHLKSIFHCSQSEVTKKESKSIAHIILCVHRCICAVIRKQKSTSANILFLFFCAYFKIEFIEYLEFVVYFYPTIFYAGFSFNIYVEWMNQVHCESLTSDFNRTRKIHSIQQKECAPSKKSAFDRIS